MSSQIDQAEINNFLGTNRDEKTIMPDLGLKIKELFRGTGIGSELETFGLIKIFNEIYL
jgi:hypothetical protein